MKKVLNQVSLIGILPKVNLLLTLCVIALAIYLTISILSPHITSADLTVESDLIIQQLNARLEKIPEFQEDVYKRRSIFNALSDKAKQGEAEFELLGIVSMGDKSSAMIRDIRENKDYYCLGGEEIGAFRVKQILKDKVILESKKQTLELSR